jgi:hypothetical protein
MTRQTIINEYFESRFSGNNISVEDLVKSKNMSKKDLIDFCKKEYIYFNNSWNKEQIINRIIGSISHMVYAFDCTRK